MRTLLVVALLSLALGACSDPKSTTLPRDLAKMESIKPCVEKLTEEEKQLVTAYIMRHTLGAKIGAMFGGKEGPGIPEGMTIAKALEEQRKFVADAAAQEAQQAALKAKLKADREAALKPMREAVTVTLVSKELKTEHGYSGMVMDEHLAVTFGYKNNTTKDIAGVKGTVTIKDLFGDDLSAFRISNDNTIAAGQTSTWSGGRSVRYSMGNNKDRKLAELADDKFKVVWEPETIVFKGGETLTLPKE